MTKKDMKINRTFSIDLEIVKILEKEDNQSNLVEKLLKEYFYGKSIEVQN